MSADMITSAYDDLDILIEKFDQDHNGYPVRFALRPHDDSRKDYPLGYLNAEILDWRFRGDTQEDGERLFDLFLKTDSTLRQNWVAVAEGHQQRRVQLGFDDHPSVAELHTIPWEVMFDTTVAEPQPIAAHRDTPFCRYIAGKSSGKTISEFPIRLVVAIANPKSLPDTMDEVDVDFETKLVEGAVAHLTNDQVIPDIVEQPVTLAKIEDRLSSAPGCILHIVAHGLFRKGEKIAYLCIDRDLDTPFADKPVTDADVASVFGRLGTNVPKFIFLASCYSAQRDRYDPFTGMAQKLILQGVPAVLAMQEKVQVPTARALTRVFYRELFEHGLIDLACNVARSEVLTKKLIGNYVPVLFSRLNNNQLLIPVIPDDGQKTETEKAIGFIRPSLLEEGDSSQLTDLLTRSGRVQGSNARRALCIEVSVDPNSLEFIEGGAPLSFARQLIQHLLDTDNRLALLRLCEALRRDLHGRHLSDLEMLRVKIEGD